MSMFSFLDMMGNYENRRVDRYTSDDLIVSTAEVNDGSRPYETAVKHPLYNDNKFIVVEAYDDKNDAQKGHDKWVKIMTSDKLPPMLEDCTSAAIGQFCKDVGGEFIYEKGKE